MALSGGQVFPRQTDVPPESRATRPPQDLDSLRGGQGTRHSARNGNDGTRWCIGCETTLGTNGTFCTTCSRERSRISAQRRRRRNPRLATLRVETLYQVAAATREIEQAILNVILARQRANGRVPSVYLDDLMVASKELAALVRQDVDPLLPAEDPRPATPGERPLNLE